MRMAVAASMSRAAPARRFLPLSAPPSPSLSPSLSLTRARARARRTHPPSVGLVLRTRLTMPFATRSFLPLAFSTTSATVRLTTGLNP